MYGLYLTTVNLRISIKKINIKYYESFYVETILCVQVEFQENDSYTDWFEWTQ